MKINAGERVFLAFDYLVMSMVLFICVYPLYYVAIYSLSDGNTAYGNVFFLPKDFTLNTYRGIFRSNDIVSALFISVARTVSGTVISVLANSFLAYLVSQAKFPWRKLTYRAIVVTMYFNAGLIPWYMLMMRLGLKNNFLLYILPGCCAAFYVILFKTFLESVPSALEESAKLDGAGVLTIYARIICPVCKPILATIAVFTAINQWNAFMDGYLLVNKSGLYTLQMVLYSYLVDASRMSSGSAFIFTDAAANQVKVLPLSIKMAITVIVTLPILLVYPFMQRYIIKGMMLGAIKG